MKVWRRGGCVLAWCALLGAGCGGEEAAEAPGADVGALEDVAAEDVAAEDAAAEDVAAAEDAPSAEDAEDVAPGCVEMWVRVDSSQGPVELFAWEASRSDATATSAGVVGGGACSRPGVIPWTTASWDEAQAACVAAGAQLCTGEVWDEGCYGRGEASYPYGGAYDPEACNVLESPDGCLTGRCQLAPTGSYGACVSAAGAWDMSGNAAEWVATPRSFGEEVYEVRGGSYTSGPDATIRCRNAHRWEARDYREPALGFRCCRAAR